MAQALSLYQINTRVWLTKHSLALGRRATLDDITDADLGFFHQGQFEGRQKRISPHLVRGPEEPINQRLTQFYDRLLAVLRDPVIRHGDWQLLECCPAWEGNWSMESFVTFAWTGTNGDRRLVTVNYSDHQSQCYLLMPWTNLAGRIWQLRDRMGPAFFERNGEDLTTRGLYLDMPAWASHIFEMRTAAP